MSGARILVVDDEPQIVRAIAPQLEARGYQVLSTATGQEALRAVPRWRPDLILLDLMLPDVSGLEVCRQIRAEGQTPLIVLSARGEERTKIEALDLGADDYLTKPFGMGELLARIRVALRRGTVGRGSAAVFTTGELSIDFDRRRVEVAGREAHLTPIEYALRKELALHAGKVLTQRMLLRAVWGAPYEDQGHYLRVHIGHLRHKIEPDPAQPRYILTDPGVGYRLASDEV
jgi:two-component system KDP operon response regulator KdpE